jgi:valyl-tRNA synthetase
MAPFTPYVCEEVYQIYFRKHEGKDSVHVEDWPVAGGVREMRHDDKTWSRLLEVIGKVRQKKSEAKRAMNSVIALTLTKEEMKELEKVIGDLRNVTAAKEIKEGKEFRVEFL